MDDSSFPGFRPRALTFLRQLARHNDREWFEAHRETYENELKAPMLALVEEVDARLGAVAPEIVGTPRRSVFRIHRDVRFSKDKRPYKTSVACWFYHRDVDRASVGEAVHGGAGFYFHLEPGKTFCGGGIWMPPRPVLTKIRQSLADDHTTFQRLVTNPSFKRRFGALDEEGMLQRIPRGFAPDHPAGRWLRFTSFTVDKPLTDTEVARPSLPDVLAREFAALLPLVRWLNGAVGLRAAERR